jgi:hypothetical protein
MNEMELNPEDQKVIDLLSKLKNSNGAYPSDILAARRQTYLKQVANVGLGIGIGAGLKNAAKSGNSAGPAATVTSKILEITLIAAIAIEAGTVAYLYREKIADAIRTYTGSANAQDVFSPSDDASSPGSELLAITESPSVIVTTPSGTVTVPSVTTSGTPSPEVADDNGNNTGVSANATPDPGDSNGNQYGLTPKPERTKDTNNNKNNDSGTDRSNTSTSNENKKDKDK